METQPTEVPEAVKVMAGRLSALDAFIDAQLKADATYSLQQIMEVLLLKARHLCFAYDESGSFLHCLGWMGLVINSKAPEYYELIQQYKKLEAQKCQSSQDGEQSTSESTSCKATESSPSQDTTSISANIETFSESSNTIQEETKS